MKLSEKDTALVFKALCDENRMKILNILSSGEKCACRLLETLSVTQPTLSHHMKILCDAEVVKARKDGKWMHYSLSSEGLRVAESFLDTLKNTGKENEND